VATIKEVSCVANVSMATVSRVLNGTAPVSEPMRSRVMRAIEQLEYQPNAFARALATNRSNGVGVIVSNLASPFFGPMLSGIESVFEPNDMHIMVSSGHANLEDEREALNFLLQRKADALVIHSEALSEYELIQLSRRDTPIVLLGRHVPELADRCVYLDNERGGSVMTRYLVEQGHSRIAHISGPQSLYDSRARLAGYRKALEEAGIEFDEGLVVEANFQEEGGYLAMRRLLDRGLGFTALFASNDQSAAGALIALREAGLQVPTDISLAGYDDVLYARYLYPALTTVSQPLFEMGREAAKLALALLEGTKVEVRHRFDPLLVTRESVRKL
jgi:LacI family transcriptional regulator